MAKRGRKKTASQFSVEQWFKRKLEKDRDRDRKAEVRRQENTAEKEKRRASNRDREAERRRQEDTAEKEKRRASARGRDAERRQQEDTAVKEKRRVSTRNREAERRQQEDTAEKEKRRVSTRNREAERRQQEDTAEKEKRRVSTRNREAERRQQEDTAEKEKRRVSTRNREAERRQQEDTAEKEKRRVSDRDCKAEHRQQEDTAEKGKRRVSNRDCKAKRRQQEDTAEKEKRRVLDREKKGDVRSRQRTVITTSERKTVRSDDRKTKKNYRERKKLLKFSSAKKRCVEKSHDESSEVASSQARRSLKFDPQDDEAAASDDSFAEFRNLNVDGDECNADPSFDGVTNDFLSKELMANPVHGFHVAMWSIENSKCLNCKERSFLIKLDKKKQWCERCRSNRPGSDSRKFTAANNMDPGEVPEELEGLTPYEEILISRVVPMMSVYRLPLGQLSYSGNIVNIPQDVQHVVNVLPRTAEESGLITFRCYGKQGTHKHFRVRRDKVKRALLWLKANNDRYIDIEIANDRITSLPVDGFLDVCKVDCDLGDDGAGTSGLNAGKFDPHVVRDMDTNTVELPGSGLDGEVEGTLDTGKEPMITVANADLAVSDEKDPHAIESEDIDPNPTESFIPRPANLSTEHDQKQFAAQKVFDKRNLKKQEKPVFDWPPRSTNNPVDEFNTAGYIFDCFPTLFPYGKDADLLGDRPVKPVSEQDYFKHMINFHDGRFAKHPRFRYFALNTTMQHRAMKSGRIFVKKNRDMAESTIEELRHLSKGDQQELMKKILRYGQSFSGSRPYWMSRRGDLLAMIRQKRELPTVFFTLSAADCQWPDLHRHIPGSDRPGYSKFTGVNENPLVCDVFFFLRVKKFLDFMKKQFNMCDYWGRFEYQHRGSVHFHGLAWFADAPDIQDLVSKSDAEKDAVVKYFDKLLTAVNPGLNEDGTGHVPSIKPNPASVPYFRAKSVFKSEETDYTGIIMYCHRHVCRVGYCCKEVKGVVQPCRFHFPKDLVPETNIEVVKDSKERQKCAINLKRNDRYINSHSRPGALANRANSDFQPVCDIEDVASYCAKYVTKPEKMQNSVSNLLGQLVLNSTCVIDPVRKLAQKALIRLVSDRHYSAQETIHLLLSLPLFLSSRTFVPLFLSGDRELVKEDGEALLVSNSVDRYCSRGPLLEKLSMFEVYQKYRFEKNEFRKLSGTKENIVVPKGLRRVTKESPLYEEYCERYLMLHKPFRKLGDLLADFTTYGEAYNDFLLSEDVSSACFANLEDKVSEQERHPDEDVKDDDKNKRGDTVLEDFAWLLQLNPEFKSFGDENFDWCEAYAKRPDAYDRVKEFHQLLQNAVSVNDANDVIDNVELNLEQKRAYDDIKVHADNPDISKAPLKTIISGSAGTGKTIFIKKLKQYLGEKLLVMAPTGVAACNAEGLTVNSALGIPAIISEETFSEKTSASKEALQDRFRSVEYVILEEVSMIGLRKFCMIDRRLREAFPLKSDQMFGGCSVILVGDFGQLPPIGDYSLFRFVSRNWAEIAPKLSPFQAQGLLAYLEFRTCFKFSTIIRQSNDTIFRDLLQRVRNGEVTKDDYDILRTRFRGNVRDEADFADAVHLFTSRKEVAEFNLNKLTHLREPIAVIQGEHTGGAAAKKAESDDAGNLEATVLLSKQSKVMLTANLDVKKGLCNGTMGEIVNIIYRDQGPPHLPLCVLCHFNDYAGPAFFPEAPKVVPIVPITRRFQLHGVDCSRTNVPLRLAWAITVHKAQGLTLPKAVLNLGKSEFNCGLAFVGLSRVRCLKDLLLDPFDYSRLRQLGEAKKDGSNPLAILRHEDLRLERMSHGLDVDEAANNFSDLQSKIMFACDEGTLKKFVKKTSVKRKLKADDVKDVPKTKKSSTKVKSCNVQSAVDVIGDRNKGSRKKRNSDDTIERFKFTRAKRQKRDSADSCNLGDNSFAVNQSMFYRPETTFVRENQCDETFVFSPLSEQRMRAVCERLGDLSFHSRDVYNVEVYRHVGSPPQRFLQVRGDGHCFYHAISRALTGEEDYHMHLREHLARYYEEIWEGDAGYISGVRSHLWGSVPDAVAMSKLLDVPIYMYSWSYSHGGQGVTQYKLYRFGHNDLARYSDPNCGIYLFHCDTYGQPTTAGNHFVLVTHV